MNGCSHPGQIRLSLGHRSCVCGPAVSAPVVRMGHIPEAATPRALDRHGRGLQRVVIPDGCRARWQQGGAPCVPSGGDCLPARSDMPPHQRRPRASASAARSTAPSRAARRWASWASEASARGNRRGPRSGSAAGGQLSAMPSRQASPGRSRLSRVGRAASGACIVGARTAIANECAEPP